MGTFAMIARTAPNQDAATCPECDGSLTVDTVAEETVCEGCGLVVAEDRLDRGPEWRAFSAQENDSKARVGAPMSQMLHDKGLSTNIGWQNKDANGNPLSPKKSRQLKRLRTWNTRCQTWHGKERNLKQALTEINRMASALGLPQPARETASVIYRRALADDLLQGRSIEAVATAALYAATRLEGIPRTLDEMATVARIEFNWIARAYRSITGELGLAIEPTDPTAYLPRFVSKLGCSTKTHRVARDHLETIKGTAYVAGKNPVGLAAAALYAATCQTGERTTQQEISDVAEISCMTIRTHYRELQHRHE